jgi:hypothetical protein
MRFSPYAFAAALLAPLLAPPAHAASFYVTTGTGLATATITESSPLSWDFAVNPPFAAMLGGAFAMRSAPGTTWGIRMELIDVTNSSVIGGTTLSVDDFTAAGGNPVSFVRIVFGLASSLTVGEPYRITLSLADNPSEATEQGSYTLRGATDELQFAETEDPHSIAVAADATETPEPAAALVLATALLGLATARRRASA